MSRLRVSKNWLGSLLVLIVCLAGLGAYSDLYFSSHQALSPEKLKPIANAMKPIIDQLEIYRDAHGRYPSSLIAVGLPDSIMVHGSPTQLHYTSSLDPDQFDPHTGTNVISPEMSLGIHIDSANVLLYQHTADLKGWRLLTGTHSSTETLEL